MSNHLQHLRGTGRTTRLLQYASVLATNGLTVVILADNGRDLTTMENQFRVLAPNARGVVFVPLRSEHFNWRKMEPLPTHPGLAGVDRESIYLVDHHAIEDHWGPLLDMLHSFDPPQLKPVNPNLQ